MAAENGTSGGAASAFAAGLGAAAADGAVTDVPPAPGQTQPAAGDGLDRITVVGHATWLMMQTPTHKHLFLADLEWLVLPPVVLGQFRLWRRGDVPVGFASWAYLSEEAEARVRSGVRRLAPADWKSGERLWLMDTVVPFGGLEAALKELREGVFKGRTVRMLQPGPGGKAGVVEW